MASIFENVEVGPQIEVFQLNKACVEDSFPQKVNLGVGGKFFILFSYSTIPIYLFYN